MTMHRKPRGSHPFPPVVITALTGSLLALSPTLALGASSAAGTAAESSATPSGPEPQELATIVVTGEKMGREQRDTSASVAVLDGQSQQDMNDDSPLDTLRRAGNAVVTDNGQFSLRGINVTGPEDSRSGFGQPLASVVVDGIVQDRISLSAGLNGSYDIEQIEVLRGPQSTSLGRNALAGAIVVNTRNPADYWEAGIRARISENNTRQLNAMLNAPLAENLAARLVLEDSSSDGFVTNTRNTATTTDDVPDWAASRQQMARLKLGLTNTAPDAVHAVLTLQAGRNEQDGLPVYLQRAGASPRTSEANEASRAVREHQMASLDISFPLSDSLRLQSITSGLQTEEKIRADNDLGAAKGAYYTSEGTGDTISQELRLNWKGQGRSRASLGVYAAYIDQPYAYDLYDDPIDVGSMLPSLPIPLPIPNPISATAYADYHYGFSNKAINKAVFAEWDHDFGRLLMTLGLRYDQEERTQQAPFTVSRVDLIACALVGCLPAIDIRALAIQAGLVPNAGNDKAKAKYDALLPKVALNYTLAPGVQIFASYTEGYRAGGAEILFTTGELNRYDPEYTRNYEVGWRIESADQRWMSSLNLFHIDWRDQQVVTSTPNGRDSITVNAASSTLDGAELGLTLRPLPGLSLMSNLGFVRSRFKDFIKDGEDYSGDAFTRSPRFTGSVGGVWRSTAGNGGPMAALNLSYVDTYYSTIRKNTRVDSGDYYLLDARVGWEAASWGAYLFGRNLLDEEYTTYSTIAMRYPSLYSGEVRNVAWGAPRTFGVEMEARY